MRDAGHDAAVLDAGGYAYDPCVFVKKVWGVEGDTLVVPLVCDDGRSIPPDRFALQDAPSGMEVDLAAGVIRWTPALDQAANYLIPVTLSEHALGELRIGVVDRFEDPENTPIVEAGRYAYELGLPVFHLVTAPEINDDEYTPTSLIYAGDEYAGVQAKYRGSTSRNYPKRSFTIKFAKGARFTDEAHDIAAAHRLVLTSTFDDNSMIRQRLAFELWNRLDRQHIPIRHFNAVVYLNGSYHGVYVVTDHVDEDLLKQLGYPSNINLYKARLKEANFRLTDRNGAAKSELRAGYTKEAGSRAPEEPEAYTDLEALVSWVASASDSDFRDQFPQRLASDFEQWMVLVTLSAAVDTTNKNYYLVRDTRDQAADTHWRFIPWDFNASFGQTTGTLRRSAQTYDLARFSRANRLFERMMSDPTLRAQVMQRFHNALTGPWTSEQIAQTLERYASEVGAAAQRDELRWQAQFRAYFVDRVDYTSHAEEIAYLRTWIDERWRMIADQLDE